MNKEKSILNILLLFFTIVGCTNNSEEKCRDDAKVALRDSCLGGLITNPIVDTDNSSYDLVLASCVRYSYKLNQCSKKRTNL